MPKFSFVKGEEDLILPVFIQNSSLSTGLGLAGLDEASSIAGAYTKRNGVGIAVAVDEDVSAEGTYQAPSSAAHIRIGKGANTINGRYELHIHNDLLTTADFITIDLVGATNMPPLLIEIQLTTINFNVANVPQTADNNVILAHGDYGNAKLARTGADSDTLETLSDQIDGRAPSGEYNTEMARITANVATETKQDIIDTNVDTLLTRLSANRAGYMDNLNIGELVAGTSEVGLTTDTVYGRIKTAFLFYVPSAGTLTFRIWWLHTDNTNNMEDPDAAPTIGVTNGQPGASRNANLNSTTMTKDSTGMYYEDYTLDSAHLDEQLDILVTAVEGGLTQKYRHSLSATSSQAEVAALYTRLLVANSELTSAAGKNASTVDKIETIFHPIKNGVDTDANAGTAVTKNDDGSAHGTQTITEDATNSDIGKMT